MDILQDLLEDDSVTEIMINGYKNIFIERQGKLHRYPGHFSDNEKLYQVIQQVASGANRMVNERNPIVDARLNDGSSKYHFAADIDRWGNDDDPKVCKGTDDISMAL